MGMRDDYIKKLQARLDEWNAEIDKLQAKLKSAEADAQAEYREQIEKLEQERSRAQERLKELQQASEDTWQDLKAGAENAWDSMDQAIKSAMSRFK